MAPTRPWCRARAAPPGRLRADHHGDTDCARPVDDDEVGSTSSRSLVVDVHLAQPSGQPPRPLPSAGLREPSGGDARVAEPGRRAAPQGEDGDPIAAAVGAYACFGSPISAPRTTGRKPPQPLPRFPMPRRSVGSISPGKADTPGAGEFVAWTNRAAWFTDGLSFMLERLRLYLEAGECGLRGSLRARRQLELLKRLAPIVDFGKPVLTFTEDPSGCLSPRVDQPRGRRAPEEEPNASGERVSEPAAGRLEAAASPVHAPGAEEDAPEPDRALPLGRRLPRDALPPRHVPATERTWLSRAKLNRISSVSGGSITSGVLARNWDCARLRRGGVARGFDRRSPIRSTRSRAGR